MKLRNALIPALLCVLTVLPGPVAGQTRDRWRRWQPTLNTLDSLAGAGATPVALVRLDSLLARAAATHDEDLRIVASLTRARTVLARGGDAAAEATLHELAPVLEARRDTTGLCRALRALARLDSQARRFDAGRTTFQRALLLARQARLPAEIGGALSGLGALEFDAEQYRVAAERYQAAIAAFGRSDPRGRVTARAGWARALIQMNHLDEARPQAERAVQEARALGFRTLEGDLHYNLGVIEHFGGDLAKAAGQYRAALAIYRQIGWAERVLSVSHPLSLVYINGGRLAEADSTLTGAVAGMAGAPVAVRAALLSQFGVLRREQGRWNESVALQLHAMELADSVPARNAVNILMPLLATYDQMNRPDQKLALLESQLVKLRTRLGAHDLQAIEMERGRTLRQSGRPRDAMVVYAAHTPDWRDTLQGSFGASTLYQIADVARCQHDLGNPDSAIVWYSRVTHMWELWRRGAADPVWREKYDDCARHFYGDYLQAVLDPRRTIPADARAREGFDALQQFRARTLMDRARDRTAAGPCAVPPVGAAALQSALAAGEVFIDVHALEDTAYVFVLTPTVIRAYGIHGGASLVQRLVRLRALVADRSSAPSPLANDAAAAIGRDVFGAAADLVVPSRRVILAAGTLARLGLEQAIVPGESVALVASREMTWVPSATWFVDARRQTPAVAPLTILALAQSAPWQGAALPGARREATWLASHFAGADAIVDRELTTPTRWSARAPRYQVLHVAAHTRSGGGRPWQDAVRLGASNREDAWLTAAEIARLDVPARVCVLAGCHTLGTAYGNGETLESLATAWLIAGARTVIATQWAVDDAATTELMRRFYQRLAGGEGAAAALHGAQLELRAMPRYSRPYYWAGLLVLGDPDTRVTLSARQGGTARVTAGR